MKYITALSYFLSSYFSKQMLLFTECEKKVKLRFLYLLTTLHALRKRRKKCDSEFGKLVLYRNIKKLRLNLSSTALTQLVFVKQAKQQFSWIRERHLRLST